MNEKVVIILAFVCAAHRVVDGRRVQAEAAKVSTPIPPVAGLQCWYIYSNGLAMMVDCAETGKLHKN